MRGNFLTQGRRIPRADRFDERIQKGRQVRPEPAGGGLMEVVRDYRQTPARLRRAAVAIGNFDGVHRGHRVVVGAAQALACEAGRPAGVISFHPHPRRFFAPGEPFFRLTPLPVKLRLLEALGLDAAFIVAFDGSVAAMSPQAFIDEVLVAGFGVSHIVAGWNFRFGARRAGDVDTLRAAGARHGFGVSVVGRHEDPQGTAYSSTLARRLIGEGRVGEAAEVLGYRWRLIETVVSGAGRGTGLGYPTINLRLNPGVDLAEGIYAVRVLARGQSHGGAAYHGTRPTFGAGERLLEVFLFDFSGDLYGEEVEVEFIAHLRGDRTFSGPQALARQIEEDCSQARVAIASLKDEAGPVFLSPGDAPGAG